MRDKLKWKVSYTLGATALASLLVTFALDSRYSNNPLIPDASLGRVFPREIRLHGVVYLTASEYEPYRWLMALALSCGVLIIVIHGIDYFQTKFKPSTKPNPQTHPDKIDVN